MSYLFVFSYCSWVSQGKNSEVVYHSLLQWTTFCQALTSRDMPFSPGVPLLVLTDGVKASVAVRCYQRAARGRGRGPAGVAGKGVQGRLEPVLEDAQERRAPWSLCCRWLPWGQSAASLTIGYMNVNLKISC